MGGLSDYIYDDNGNMTGKEQGETFWSYSYDYENRLTKVKQGSDSTLFYYNGDGQRLKKVCTGDTSTQYIPDGMYSAVERTNGGRLRYKYVYANGMLLARIDSTGRKFYYHHDALGSTIGISDSNYAVYKSYLYDEFGDSLGAWGSTPYNTYRYTGQEYDAKPMYAYNLRAREYFPKLGRFMQEDPIRDAGGSLNWYLYVRNNPVNNKDITGLGCCKSDISFLESAVKFQSKYTQYIDQYNQGKIDYFMLNLKIWLLVKLSGGTKMAETICNGNTPTIIYYNKSDENSCYGKCVKIHEDKHAEQCRAQGAIYMSGPFGDGEAYRASLPCFKNCLNEAKSNQ